MTDDVRGQHSRGRLFKRMGYDRIVVVLIEKTGFVKKTGKYKNGRNTLSQISGICAYTAEQT